MQQILGESGTANISKPSNASDTGKSEILQGKQNGDLNESLEEDGKERNQVTTNPNKENASQVSYGSRDDYQGGRDGGKCSSLDSDPLSEIVSLSKDFFKNVTIEEAAVAQLTKIVKPSVQPELEEADTDHPVIAALRQVAAFENASVKAAQDILNSDTLPASLREANPELLVSSIYDVMLRHSASREAQILCIQLLQKTAMHVPDAAATIGKGNGIQLIVHAMLVNKECGSIQIAAAAALAALCTTTQNRIVAAKFYAVEAIASATMNFIEERYLQGACMKLLAALASERANMEAITRTNSVRVPFRVMKRHRRSTTLVRMACECTHVLLQNLDKTAVKEVARMNPSKLFLYAILEHPEDERVQAAATECATICCIMDRFCLEMCIRGRAPELCVRNLKKYRGKEHGKLQLACMKMLCLFADAGCQKILVSAGALEGCLTCMIEMRRVFAMQFLGLRVLEQVVATDEEAYIERIVAAGGIDVLNQSLKAYISREEFVHRGVHLLRLLRG